MRFDGANWEAAAEELRAKRQRPDAT